MNGSPIPPVVKELMLSVDPARAFRTFTEQVRSWWPVATHSVGGVDGIGLRLDEDGFVEMLADGTECEWGAVLAWEPPHRLAMTWHPGQPADPHTRVEVTFEPVADGTLVRLVHSGWEALAIPDAARVERLEEYRKGWDVVLAGLVALVGRGGDA